jgi:hypothetical protein
MLLEEGNISKPDIGLSNEDSSNRKRSSSLTEQVSTFFALSVKMCRLKSHPNSMWP